MKVLKLDVAGNPVEWINHKQAISLIASNRFLANLGKHVETYYGGYNSLSNVRSSIDVSSVLLSKELVVAHRFSKEYEPFLTNDLLFKRDGCVCMYCGGKFRKEVLTRDHIMPSSRGGEDRWGNVVTACKPCNASKSDKTPEEWGFKLLAVPFTPNNAEFLYLQNSGRIKNDQFEFLVNGFPKDSVLLS